MVVWVGRVSDGSRVGCRTVVVSVRVSLGGMPRHDNSLTALRLVRDWPSAPGAHLLRAWKAGIQSLLDLHPDLQIVFQWCPGHSDILGNEWADSEAKEATKLAPSTAPPSISALKEKNTRQTMENRAKLIDRPRASPANKYLAVSGPPSRRQLGLHQTLSLNPPTPCAG